MPRPLPVERSAATGSRIANPTVWNSSGAHAASAGRYASQNCA